MLCIVRFLAMIRHFSYSCLEANVDKTLKFMKDAMHVVAIESHVVAIDEMYRFRQLFIFTVACNSHRVTKES